MVSLAAYVDTRVALLTSELEIPDDGPIALQESNSEDPVHKEPVVQDPEAPGRSAIDWIALDDSDDEDSARMETAVQCCRAADPSVTHRTVPDGSNAEQPVYDGHVGDNGELGAEAEDQSDKVAMSKCRSDVGGGWPEEQWSEACEFFGCDNPDTQITVVGLLSSWTRCISTKATACRPPSR